MKLYPTVFSPSSSSLFLFIFFNIYVWFWTKKQWTLFILHLRLVKVIKQRLREKYPKHDNRESAENETIEMRIKIHLNYRNRIFIFNFFFINNIIFTMELHSKERRSVFFSISNVILETVIYVKLENHLFMSNFYQPFAISGNCKAI